MRYLSIFMLTFLFSCQDATFYEKEQLKELFGPEDEIAKDIDDTNYFGSDDGSGVGTSDGSGTGTSVGTGDGSGTGTADGSGGSGDGSGTGNGGGTGTHSVNDQYTQTPGQSNPVDILWVIDDSGSMADNQAALAYNFDVFINDFITQNVDFQMYITTTDPRSYKAGKIVDGSDSLLNAEKAQEDPTKFKNDFRNLIQVGTSGSGNEQGLNAVDAFNQRYSFVNGSDNLAIVYVSDEEDQSPNSVQEYVNSAQAIKDNAGLVKAYSIVDMGTSCVSGGGGYTCGYARYEEMSSSTNGVTTDINQSFYSTLQDLGQTILQQTKSFALSEIPVGNVEVYINGTQVTQGWTYNAQTNSIEFDQAATPQEGDLIEIRYSAND